MFRCSLDAFSVKTQEEEQEVRLFISTKHWSCKKEVKWHQLKDWEGLLNPVQDTGWIVHKTESWFKTWIWFHNAESRSLITHPGSWIQFHKSKLRVNTRMWCMNSTHWCFQLLQNQTVVFSKNTQHGRKWPKQMWHLRSIRMSEKKSVEIVQQLWSNQFERCCSCTCWPIGGSQHWAAASCHFLYWCLIWFKSHDDTAVLFDWGHWCWRWKFPHSKEYCEHVTCSCGLSPSTGSGRLPWRGDDSESTVFMPNTQRVNSRTRIPMNKHTHTVPKVNQYWSFDQFFTLLEPRTHWSGWFYHEKSAL